MIKIAFFIDTIGSPTGGTEKQLLYLLNGLDRNRFSPYLFCLYRSEWMKTQNFSFPVISFDLKKILSFNFIKAIVTFISIHRKEKFTIVQTFFKDSNILGVIAGRLAKVPYIVSSRRNLGYWHNPFQIKILRILKHWTTYFIGNSKAAIEMTIDVEKAQESQCKIVYNGIDLQRFDGISATMRNQQREKWRIKPDQIAVGIVANLRPVKRIDIVINCSKRLLSEYPNLKFILIGDGPERKNLEALINEKGLSEHYSLVGKVQDIVSGLSAIDIALLPSSSESFSNALIEYMAAGLPIVATKVGGNIEAITHTEDGLLYDFKDDTGLINNLKSLIENPNDAKRMAKKAQTNAKNNYSIEKMINTYQEFYCNPETYNR